jgi:hypothetical protein
MGLEGRHQVIAEPHERSRIELGAQPLGQQFHELIQRVLDRAFTQVRQ